MSTKFTNLMEMSIEDIINAVMPPSKEAQVFKIEPNTGIGSFGNISGNPENNIQIRPSECGGILIKSKDMNIKLSKEVLCAIKQHLLKGEQNV